MPAALAQHSSLPGTAERGGYRGLCCRTATALKEIRARCTAECKEQLSPSQLHGKRKVCREFPALPKVVSIDLNFSLVQHNLSNERSASDSAVPFTTGIGLAQAAAPPGFPDTFPLMNNLHNDYRGKPHEPSPCALPGARGRLCQSTSASAQGAADSTGAARVLTRGNPSPGFQESRTQERRGCTTLGGKGSVPRMCSQEDKAGGNRREVPDSHGCWGSREHRCHHSQTFSTFSSPSAEGTPQQGW